MVNYRPFHETIVDAIANIEDFHEFDALVRLLKETKIPKNHDAIIAALEERRVDMGFEHSFSDVFASLEDQKREAEAEAKAKLEADLREVAEDARQDCN